MIGTGKTNRIFMPEMIRVLSSTWWKMGEENNTWKFFNPTQILGGMMRTFSKAILASQIGT